MEHFTALCCFGGEPFIDFHLNGTYSKIDPTDWSADVINDFNSNSSSSADAISREGIDLSHCHMYNITFTNFADQLLFDSYKANFECRCPIDRSGPSCEFPAPFALPLSAASSTIISSLSPELPYTMILVLAAVLLAFVAVLMMMVRGCFCDCFGPFSREDPYDKPLDPEDVRKCLQKVRENQARREMASEPLVPPPLVSDSYSAPYTHVPPPPRHDFQYPSAPPVNTSYRSSSPPPPYSDIDRSPVNISSTQI